MIEIRKANQNDINDIANIILPVINAGETYALPKEWNKEEAISFWFGTPHEVYVALINGEIIGTYYMMPNQKGGGSNVANCGYMTSEKAQGKGVASAMCLHSQDIAKNKGFFAMQFNFVISTNIGAVKLWQKLGFDILCNIPKAFDHPRFGKVDAHLMYKIL